VKRNNYEHTRSSTFYKVENILMQHNQKNLIVSKLPPKNYRFVSNYP